MNDLERLEFEVGPKLEAAGGILDNLDYSRLRRLGVQLRNIPSTRDDWDFPPSSLQGWIASYVATVEVIRIGEQSGLIPLMKSRSGIIRDLLSPAMIPLTDLDIVGRENLDSMIVYAKSHDRFADFDFEVFSSSVASREEIARAVVVELDTSILWTERPKVNRDVGLKRIQIGALIGKAASGGALAVANLSLGALAGLSVFPAVIGNVPIAVGVVGSTYTGFAAAFDAIEKIAATIRG